MVKAKKKLLLWVSLLLALSLGKQCRPFEKLNCNSKSLPHSFTHRGGSTNVNHNQLLTKRSFDWFTRKKGIELEDKRKKSDMNDIFIFTILSILSIVPKERRVQILTWMHQKTTYPDVLRCLFQQPCNDGTWVLSLLSQKILLFVSSITTIQEIRTNGIISLRKRKLSKIQMKNLVDEAGMALSDRIFPPRLHFTIGALARGIQLCTNLQYGFDPSPGFGALVNFGALWVRQRWVPRFILGWALTEKLWKLFGARPPNRQSTKEVSNQT